VLETVSAVGRRTELEQKATKGDNVAAEAKGAEAAKDHDSNE